MSSVPADRPAIRVLIADDTADIRLLLRLALKVAGGFEVVGEVGDGRAAVREAGQLQPDIVLLDLAMPVMDGLQALPELRIVAPDAIVVVLSGFGAETMAADALALGAHEYVQKGLDAGDLATLLWDLIEARAAEGAP